MAGTPLGRGACQKCEMIREMPHGLTAQEVPKPPPTTDERHTLACRSCKISSVQGKPGFCVHKRAAAGTMWGLKGCAVLPGRACCLGQSESDAFVMLMGCPPAPGPTLERVPVPRPPFDGSCGPVPCLQMYHVLLPLKRSWSPSRTGAWSWASAVVKLDRQVCPCPAL